MDKKTIAKIENLMKAESRVESGRLHMSFAMTNISSMRSKLPNNIFIFVSPRAGAKHGPRVKVSNIRGKFADDNTFSLTVCDSPQVVDGKPDNSFTAKDLDALNKWIVKRQATLLEIWNSDTLDSEQIIEMLCGPKPPIKPKKSDKKIPKKLGGSDG